MSDLASICKRGKGYSVIYYVMDYDGKRVQKWVSCKTLADAKQKKKEIEYRLSLGNFTVPPCKKVNELLNEYIVLHGKSSWALSTYQSNVALIDHYIRPFIGEMKLSELSTRVIERYYQQLLHTRAVPAPVFGKTRQVKGETLVTPQRVRSVHKILRNCFNQAVKWELMEKNPCQNASLPKVEPKKREIWTAETIFRILDSCDDGIFKMALNLTFACSLRMGELLGLTWDCVDISTESIANGCASIYVEKELQRVSREALATLENKDVIRVFPALNSRTSTVVVLKSTKTESSRRKVFLPKTVALMLVDWKKKQDETKVFLGEEYADYDLVFAGSLGYPCSDSAIRGTLKELIKENDLPPVVFHSFRHASITYKLKLNGGDIKAVQGDSGHAQAKMVTDIYSHVLDDSRIRNAELFEDAFYKKKHLDVDLSLDDSDEVEKGSVGKTSRNVDHIAEDSYGIKETSGKQRKASGVTSDAPTQGSQLTKRQRGQTGRGKVDTSEKDQKSSTKRQNTSYKRKEEPEKDTPKAETPSLAGVDAETLARLLTSPEFAALVKLLDVAKKT